jgi:hypothetical protein
MWGISSEYTRVQSELIWARCLGVAKRIDRGFSKRSWLIWISGVGQWSIYSIYIGQTYTVKICKTGKVKKSCSTSARERSILQSWVLGRFARREPGVEVDFKQNTDNQKTQISGDNQWRTIKTSANMIRPAATSGRAWQRGRMWPPGKMVRIQFWFPGAGNALGRSAISSWCLAPSDLPSDQLKMSLNTNHHLTITQPSPNHRLIIT